MILIALGANLSSRYGAPEVTLHEAVCALERLGVRVLARSSIWLSAPVPVSDQPLYRNAVIAAKTSLDVWSLLRLLKALETDFGRASAARNAARVLDLDIIAYNNDVVEREGLSVPHPRAHERAFVLYPLREVAPNWAHPCSGRSVEDLISALPAGQDIRKQSEEAA